MRSLIVLFLLVLMVSPVAVRAEVPYDTPFEIAMYESVVLGDDVYNLIFTDVLNDARCSVGEPGCTDPGDAEVGFALQPTGLDPVFASMHTDAALGSEFTVGDFTVRLIALTPVPAVGETIDQSAYVATIEVSNAAVPNVATTWGGCKATFR